MKMILVLAIILLSAATLHAAQPKTFTITEGEHPYGPIPVGSAHRFATVSIDAWSEPTITAVFQIENLVSGVWLLRCILPFRGDPVRTAPHPIECTLDANATQVRAIVTVAGGSIVLTREVTAGTK